GARLAREHPRAAQRRRAPAHPVHRSHGHPVRCRADRGRRDGRRGTGDGARRRVRGAVDAGGDVRGGQAGGGADVDPGEAGGERLECVRVGAHIGYAAQQSLQENRAVRAGPGGVVAGSEKERDWDKEMAEVDRLRKKLPNADPTLGRGAGYEPPATKPSLSTVTPRGGVAPPSGSGRLGTWAKGAPGVLV